MSLCKRCGRLSHGGACLPWKKAAPAPVEYRIEKCGGLTVYHPVQRSA